MKESIRNELCDYVRDMPLDDRVELYNAYAKEVDCVTIYNRNELDELYDGYVDGWDSIYEILCRGFDGGFDPDADYFWADDAICPVTEDDFWSRIGTTPEEIISYCIEYETSFGDPVIESAIN